MKTFRVTISTLDRAIFSGEAISLSVPAVDGMVTILPGHEPFISPIKKGIAVVKTETETKEFPVESGILETTGDQVTLLL